MPTSARAYIVSCLLPLTRRVYSLWIARARGEVEGPDVLQHVSLKSADPDPSGRGEQINLEDSRILSLQ